jgi:prophage antirepressor-like protein
MNTNLIPFQFEDRQIRVLVIDGDPWWVAFEICSILGISNGRDAVSRLDDDEKTSVAITDSLINQGFSSNAPGTKITLINEPGMYSLVMTSRKPEAKTFKRWVTHDVIPSIRKTGRYEVPTFTHARARTIYEDAADRLEQELRVGKLLEAPLHIVQQESVKLVRRETGIDYSHHLTYAKAQQDIKKEDVMLEPTELAKELGLKNATAMNKWLAEHNLQVKVGKEWKQTEEGEKHSTRHAWSRNDKTGYNLKWNVQSILNINEAA